MEGMNQDTTEPSQREYRLPRYLAALAVAFFCGLAILQLGFADDLRTAQAPDTAGAIGSPEARLAGGNLGTGDGQLAHADTAEIGRSPWETGAPTQESEAPTTTHTRQEQRPETERRTSPQLESAPQAPKAPGLTSDLPDVAVLCYHLNLPGRNTYRGFNITPSVLRKQLTTLREQGYRTIRLAQLEALLRGERRGDLPQRPLLLTFDDGPKSNLTVVEPLLRELDFTGVAFLYPSILSSGKRNYLTWAEARRLARSDRFEIGSHTYWHPKLPELGDGELRMQMTKSRRVLEEKLGLPGGVKALAYPFGLYDRRVMAAAREAGYRLAFTVNPARISPGDDPLTLNRYMVTSGQTLNVFQKTLSLSSPRGLEVYPPDGSSLREAQSLRLRLPGFTGLRVTASLNGRRIALRSSGAETFTGPLPQSGRRRYNILTVRAHASDGSVLARQLLYHNHRAQSAAAMAP